MRSTTSLRGCRPASLAELQGHRRLLVIVPRHRLRVLVLGTLAWRAVTVVVAPRLTGMGNELLRVNGTRETAVVGRSREPPIAVMLLMEGNVASGLLQVGMANESVTETRSEGGIGMEIVRGTEIGTVNVVGNVIRTRKTATIETKTVREVTGIVEMRRIGSEMVVGGRGMVLGVVMGLRRTTVRYLHVRIPHGTAPNLLPMKLLESDGGRQMTRFVYFGLSFSWAYH